MKVIKSIFIILFVILLIGAVYLIPLKVLDDYNQKIEPPKIEIKDEEVTLTDLEKQMINKKTYDNFRYVLNSLELENKDYITDLLFKYNVVWYLLADQTTYIKNIDMYSIDLDVLLEKYKKVFNEDLNLRKLQELTDIKIEDDVIMKAKFYGTYPKGYKNDKITFKISNKVKGEINTLYYYVYDISNIEYTDIEYFELINPETLTIDNKYNIGVLEIKYKDKEIKSFEFKKIAEM